jgi:hypothetical protein
MNITKYAWLGINLLSIATACGAPADGDDDAGEENVGSTSQALVADEGLSRIFIPPTRLDTLPAAVDTNDQPGSNFLYFTTTSGSSTGPFFAQLVSLRPAGGEAVPIHFCGGFSCTGQFVRSLAGSIPAPTNEVLVSRQTLLAGVFGACEGSGDVTLDFDVSTEPIPDAACIARLTGIPPL